MNKLKAFSVM